MLGNKKVLKALKSIKTEREQIAYYVGVEKNEDPKLVQRYEDLFEEEAIIHTALSIINEKLEKRNT